MRLAQLAGDDNQNSRTFVFEDEGHTLGNALFSIISHYKDVDFCGYNVPHPSETKMHFRLQMKGNRSAVAALKQGLIDLENCCDDIMKKFNNACEEKSIPAST